jgi:hypothetical protein
VLWRIVDRASVVADADVSAEHHPATRMVPEECNAVRYRRRDESIICVEEDAHRSLRSR